MSNVAKEAIPKRARGAFVQKANDNVKIEEYDVVQPKDLKPGEALVKVLYSGVCHVSSISALYACIHFLILPAAPLDRSARGEGGLAS